MRIKRFLSMLAAALGAAAPLVAGAVPAMAAPTNIDVPNEVKRGGVVVYKYDAETKKSEPQGGAWLGVPAADDPSGVKPTFVGAKFTITNKSAEPIVYIDEFGHKHTYAVGESWDITTKWDANKKAYVAQTPAKGLPYGSYHIQETTPGTGYGLASKSTWTAHGYIPGYMSEEMTKWADVGYDFQITEQGQIVTYQGEPNGTSGQPGAYNPPIRGGIEVIKRDHDLRSEGMTAQGNATLRNAEFKIYNASGHDIVLWDHFATHDEAGDGKGEPAKKEGSGVVANGPELNQKYGDRYTDKKYTDADANGVVHPGGLVATIITGEDGRAQTFKDALPVGWYKIVETKAPDGYDLEKAWYAIVEISTDDWDTVVATDADDPVLRGGVKLQKVDEKLMKPGEPQGDASLAGATIGIYNASDHGVFMPELTGDEKKQADARGEEHKSGYIKPGGLIAKLKTDNLGQVKLLHLPYGHYKAVEEAPSEGYLKNDQWTCEFDIKDGALSSEGNTVTTDLTGDKAKDQWLKQTVIKGNIEFDKVDWETGDHQPLAQGTLQGAQVSVTNSSAHKIVWAEPVTDKNGKNPGDEGYEATYKDKTVEAGAVVTTLTTDAKGYAKIENLPYGTYTLRETKAPTGYVLNPLWVLTVQVRENGKTYSYLEADSTLKNGNIPTAQITKGALVDRIKREDIGFIKVDSDTQKQIAKIPFKVTSKTTGEWHILVTDEDGMVDTRSYQPDSSHMMQGQDSYQWRKHSYKTNVNDAAYNEKTGEVDESKLDYDAGYWFYGNKDGGKRGEVIDYLSALPYDEYTIEELRVSGNSGKKLISRDLTLKRFDADFENLGTFINDGSNNPPSNNRYGTTIEAHKTSNPKPNSKVKAGQDITYTIKYTNTGSETAKSVRVRDYVPEGTTYKSVDNDGAYVKDGDYVEWVGGELAPGASATVSYTVTVDKNPPSYIWNVGYFDKEDTPAKPGDPKNPEPKGITNTVVHVTDNSKVGPLLDSSKSVEGAKEDGTAEIGDVLTYHVKVTNTGDSDTTYDVGVTDSIPAGTEIVDKDTADGYGAPDVSEGGKLTGTSQLEWNVGHIKAGETKDVWFKVKVTSKAYSVVSNQATYGQWHCGTDCNLTNIVETKVKRHSDLKVEKTSDAKGKVSGGQIVTYTIKVTNEGHGHATDVDISDALPEGTQAVEGSVSDNGTLERTTGKDGKASVTAHWKIAKIERDGGAATVSWKVRVKPSLKEGTVIKNVASATDTDGKSDSNETSDTVVDASKNMKVTKSSDAGDYVTPGDEITYTVEWKNEGDTPAYGFGVRDAIPEHTTFVPGSIVVTGADGKTSTEIEKEQAGKDDQTKPDKGYVEDPVWTESQTVGSKTDLAAIKDAVIHDASKQKIVDWDNVKQNILDAKAGQSITFTVTNTDWYDLRWKATVQEDSSVLLSFQIIIPGIGDGENGAVANGVTGNYDKAGNAVYAYADVVKPGETGKITFKVKVDADVPDNTVIKNKATYGTGVVGMPDNDLDHETNTVETIVGTPELKATKEVDKTVVAPDGTLTYTVKVANVGHAIAKNVGIYDKIRTEVVKGVILLPETVKVSGGDSATASKGILDSMSTEADHVAAFATRLPAGETLTLTFSVRAVDVKAKDVIENTATFDRDLKGEPKSELSNKTNTTRVTVSEPSLKITAVSDPVQGKEVKRGDMINYSWTVTNDSDVAAEGVATQATTPEHTTYVSGTGVSTVGKSDDGRDVLGATGLTFKAHESKTFSMRVKVNDDVIKDTIVSFRATTGVSDSALLPLAVDSNEIQHHARTIEANLKIAADASPAPGTSVKSGDVIAYSFTVTNDTDVAVDGVAVHDAVPANTTYVAGSADGLKVVSIDEDGNSVLGATKLSFKAHESKTFSFKARVNDGITDHVTLTNQASTGVDDDATLPLAIDSNEVTHTIERIMPVIKVVETASPKSGTTVKRGDKIAYAIKVTNDSDVDAAGVAVNTVVDPSLVLDDKSLEGLSKVGVDSDGRVILGATGLSLKAHESTTLTYTAQVKSDAKNGTVVSTRATAGIDDSAELPLASTSDDVKHSITVETAKLAIEATSDPKPGTVIKPGTEVVWTVKVTNTSKDVDAEGVAVNADVPDYVALENDSLTGGLKKVGTTEDKLTLLGATGIKLKAGESKTFTYKGTVDEDVPGNMPLVMRATTGYADDATKPLPIDAKEVELTVADIAPELDIKLTQDPATGSTVAPGDTLTYTVTLTNTGNRAARNVGIYDIAPNHTTYVDGSLTASDGKTYVKDGLLINIAGDVKPKQTVTMTYKVVIDIDFEGKIRNRALWVSPAADPDKTSEDTGSSVDFDFGQVDETKKDEDKPAATKLFGLFGVVIPTNPGSHTGSSEDVSGDNSGSKDPVNKPTTGDKGDTGNSGNDSGTSGDKGESGNAGGSNTTDTDVKKPETGGTTETKPGEGNNKPGNSGSVDMNGSEGSNPVDADVSKAKIQLTKASDPASGAVVRRGQTVTYMLDATNLGDGNVNGFVISDQLPEGIEYIDGSAVVQVANSDGTVSITPSAFTVEVKDGKLYARGMLKPGEHVVVTFQGKVTAEIGKLIDNKARWDQELNGKTAKGSESNEVEYKVGRPILNVVKTSDVKDGAVVDFGDEIHYTLRLVNTGDAEAHPIVVDELPEGLTVDEKTLPEGAKLEGNKITFAEVKVDGGQTVELTYTAKVNEKAKRGGSLINRASWTEKDTDEHGKSNDHQVNVGTIDVTLAKSADVADGDAVEPGQVVTYTLKALNAGTVAAHATITDELPEGMEVVTEGLPENAKVEGRKVTFTGVEVSPDKAEPATITFKAKVSDSAKRGSTLENVAEWKSENSDESGKSNKHMVTVGKPDIAVLKSSDLEDGAIVDFGQTVKYTLKVVNSGNGKGTVSVTDKLPEGLTVDEKTLPEGAKLDGQTITFADVELKAGESRELTYSAKVNEKAKRGDALVNEATWTEKETGDNGKSNDHQVNVGTIDVTLTKSADVADGEALDREGEITYTLEAENAGNIDAHVTLTDKLPEGLTVDEKSLPAGASLKDGTVTIPNVTVKANKAEKATFTFKAKLSADAKPGSKLTNTAEWKSDNSGESGKSNDHAVTVAEPDLQVVKSSDVKDGAYVSRGDVVTYTVALTNKGAGTAYATVTDDVPEGMTVDEKSLPEGAKLEGNKITFAETKVKAGAEEKLTYKASVNKDAKFDSDLVNVATYAERGTDKTTDSNKSTVKVGKPELKVEKVADAEGALKIGDAVNYTVTVTNQGTAAADVDVSDQLPDGLALVDGSVKVSDVKDAVTDKEDESAKKDESDDADKDESGKDESATDKTPEQDLADKIGDLLKPSTDGTATVSETVDDAAQTTDTEEKDGSDKADESAKDDSEKKDDAKADGSDAASGSDNAVKGKVALKAGQYVTITYQATVTPQAYGQKDDKTKSVKVTNTATAKSDGVEDGTGSATIEVEPTTSDDGGDTSYKGLTVEKTAEGTMYTPGNEVTYHVTVKNGTELKDAISGIVAEDAPGKGLSVTSVTDADGKAVQYTVLNQADLSKTQQEANAAYSANVEALKKDIQQLVMTGVDDKDGYAALIDSIGKAAAGTDEEALAKAVAQAFDAEVKADDVLKVAKALDGSDQTAGQKFAGMVGDKLKDIESGKASDNGSNATETEVKADAKAEATKDDGTQVVRWSVPELKQGESVTYTVTATTKASYDADVTNVGNVYVGNMDKPFDSSSVTLKTPASVPEKLKKGLEDMPTTGIALGALGLIGAGACAAAYGLRHMREAGSAPDKNTDEE